MKASKIKAVVKRHIQEVWPALTADLNSSHILEVPHSYQRDSYSCVACCFQSLAAYYGTKVSRREAKKLVKCDPEDGAQFETVAPALRSLGIHVRSRILKKKDIDGALSRGQVILAADWKTYEEPHATLIIGYNDDGYWIMDPCLPYRKCIPTAEFRGFREFISYKS